jgi:hypothetical protein
MAATMSEEFATRLRGVADRLYSSNHELHQRTLEDV